MAKTTAEYLVSVAASKEAIRKAIVSKGQSCSKTEPFSQYAGKISKITSGMDFFMCVFHANGYWGGYKAILENGKYRFEKTVTDGLKYTSVTPVVGKVYTSDALAEIAYLYDISGCPYLVDCNEISCPICGTKYCETHGVHTHGSGNGSDDDDDDDDNDGDNNNNNNDNNDNQKSCPFAADCKIVSCSSCGTSYCQTHTAHNCGTETYCPFTPSCKIENCPDCQVGYCAVHNPHTCNSGSDSGCSVADCDNSDHSAVCSKCDKAYCAEHMNEYTTQCEICGLTFCTDNCYSTHIKTHKTCLVDGCNNTTAKVTCQECGGFYCAEHEDWMYDCPTCQRKVCDVCFSDHVDSPDYGDATCAVDDCDRTDFSTGKTCSECGRTFCSYHANSETWTCDVCGLTFCTRACYDVYTAHNGSHAVTCAVDGCGNTQATLMCHECGKTYCIDHASENTQQCDTCQLTYCNDCYNGHKGGCLNEANN